MTITLSDNNGYIFSLENAARGATASLNTLADSLRESNPELATQLSDITKTLIASVGGVNTASTDEHEIVLKSVAGNVNPKSVNIVRWYRSTPKPTREAFILNWEMSFGIEVFPYVLSILDDFNVAGVTLSPSAITAIVYGISVQQQG